MNIQARGKNLASLTVLSLLIISLTSICTSATATSKSFKVYHSLGQNKPFLPRGTITFSTGGGVEDETSVNDDNSITATVENEQNCLGENALQDIDDLVSNNGFYRIKVVDEENGSQSVLASVLGCEVKRANFREEISLSMSQTGQLLSVSYTPLVSPLAAKCSELQPFNDESNRDREYAFQTLISYTTNTPGMNLPKILPKMRPPPGLKAIKYKRNPNVNTSNSNNPMNDNADGSGSGNGNGNDNKNYRNKFQSEEEDEKKKQQESQSFLRKYWYIILPVTIMTFLGGEEPPQPQGQQGQQRQGQQSNGGSVAAAAAGGGAAMAGGASSGSGGAVRQRRGKRG